jgi:hypothetical protein
MAAAAAVVLLLAACATTTPAVHEAVKAGGAAELPKRVLLAPPEIRVHEVSAGGQVEKVDQWTQQASRNALAGLRRLVTSKQLFELVEAPELAAQDKTVLDQHASLYLLVAASAEGARRSQISAWRERAKTFDYTLGPGMSALAERVNADSALFLVGTDYISSSGRKAMMALGVVLAALGGTIMVPQSNPAVLSVGLADLRTGDLEWFALEIRSGEIADLRSEASVNAMLESLFKTYPGIKPAGK